MQILKQYISILSLLVLTFMKMSAQEVTVLDVPTSELDSVEVSLLTCSPGEDVYAKFGHTALRVIDYTMNEDIVFNYGCFNYNSENFVFKFILGQTDYLLGAERADYFMSRYQSMGNGVTEQKLNLTQEEANKLLTMLFVNLQPENQEYRYKWIGNNCTDKARFIVEDAIDGNVVYDFSKKSEDPSVREILHQCLANNPWVSLGIDLMLGQEIDTNSASRSEEENHLWTMFIPARFMNEADKTMIKKADGSIIPYTKDKQVLFEPTLEDSQDTIFTPTVVFGLLLGFVIFISVFDTKKKRQSVWVDILLCSAQGILGLLIAFLFFFSEHPGVDSNWLVIVLNPLPLLYAGWMYYCHRKGRPNIIAPVNLAVLTLFIPTMLLCPQSFSIPLYLMVSSLWLRSIIQTTTRNK